MLDRALYSHTVYEAAKDVIRLHLGRRSDAAPRATDETDTRHDGGRLKLQCLVGRGSAAAAARCQLHISAVN